MLFVAFLIAVLLGFMAAVAFLPKNSPGIILAKGGGVMTICGMVAIIISSCGPGPASIDVKNPGYLQDTLFGVQPNMNGSYILWMVHDDIAAYCTLDRTLGEQALHAIKTVRNPIIVLGYRYQEAGDKESLSASAGGCPSLTQGKNEIVVYKITSLEILGGS